MEGVQKISSRSFVKRALRYRDDAEAISDCVQGVTWSLQSFMVSLRSLKCIWNIGIDSIFAVGRDDACDRVFVWGEDWCSRALRVPLTYYRNMQLLSKNG